MEFSVPAADPSTFFPISVGFSALNTFSSLKVCFIILLSAFETSVEFAWMYYIILLALDLVEN
jgi:hypothetical protein